MEGVATSRKITRVLLLWVTLCRVGLLHPKVEYFKIFGRK